LAEPNPLDGKNALWKRMSNSLNAVLISIYFYAS